MIREVRPAREIFAALVRGAAEALGRAAST
jgi:hypothetical protein